MYISSINKPISDYLYFNRLAKKAVSDIRNFVLTKQWDDNSEEVLSAIEKLRLVVKGEIEFVKHPTDIVIYREKQNGVTCDDDVDELWSQQVLELLGNMTNYVWRIKDLRKRAKGLPNNLKKVCDALSYELLPNFRSYLRKNGDFYAGNVLVMPRKGEITKKLERIERVA